MYDLANLYQKYTRDDYFVADYPSSRFIRSCNVLRVYTRKKIFCKQDRAIPTRRLEKKILILRRCIIAGQR